MHAFFLHYSSTVYIHFFNVLDLTVFWSAHAQLTNHVHHQLVMCLDSSVAADMARWPLVRLVNLCDRSLYTCKPLVRTRLALFLYLLL